MGQELYAHLPLCRHERDAEAARGAFDPDANADRLGAQIRQAEAMTLSEFIMLMSGAVAVALGMFLFALILGL